METENIGDYLVNGLGGGGFSLESFSPITTINQNPSLKGGSDNTGGYDAVTVSDGFFTRLGNISINLDNFYNNARVARIDGGG